MSGRGEGRHWGRERTRLGGRGGRGFGGRGGHEATTGTARGASEVLGFSLVFALVIASVTIISVAGVGALQDARDAEQVNNAERAFDVLADNVADIYEGGAPSRATEMSLSQSQVFTGENVTINVTATTGTSSVTVERQVRPIVYHAKNDARLVYEAGAVFRVERSGGLVRRSPPIIANDERVVFPIVALQSQNIEGVGSATVLVRARERDRIVEIADTEGTYADVIVNVTSPNRDLWEQILTDAGIDDCHTGTDATGATFVECDMDPASNLRAVYVTSTLMDVNLER